MADFSNIDGLPPLRDVIAAHGLSAQKALGQNFLLDLNVTAKIVRLAEQARGPDGFAGVHVIEIGPGPGGLTRALVKSGARGVSAVEFDRRAVDALQGLEAAAAGRLVIVQGDALETDLTGLCEAPRAIVANLPYNIATPLLLGWLSQVRADPQAFSSMSLMFQKEVAARITAGLGSKAYGRLSVMAQWLCKVGRLMDLPPSAFTPPPKVVSSVVHFMPRVLDSDAPSFQAVERVTAAAFNQRRKMIRTSLKDYMAGVEALGLDPQARAEELGVQDFVKLACFHDFDVKHKKN
ncbi:MAG: 16S rRNA (adenine(1518)-N(6)/adenine(1519)-N(6))-dimethyltransferase RsmA [Alphaproteobacteria bacterium]|nr:16S rRNA (adenine(1518)-N(6)/adenine(1519)-N(6))-dimethyltransferase RsmA [Alphaproteobacteria bacterium]